MQEQDYFNAPLFRVLNNLGEENGPGVDEGILNDELVAYAKLVDLSFPRIK